MDLQSIIAGNQKMSAHTRAGFVNVPVLLAENPGAEIEFTFQGTAVGIAVVSGPDAGIITYSIDGKKEQSVDLFTKWSRNLHLALVYFIRR